jgi:UDP-N-acetylmuramate: L-alanyl-gamma-D-glutamyl-meso-diaminopimelate ligase
MIDMDKNQIPSGVRSIHLIAVCGTAMGALACMLKDLGFDVSGSDQKIYPPMSVFLRQKGIEIMDGFRAQHLEGAPDLVVVGNAVTRENPEVKQMQHLGVAFCSLPQALNRFVADGKKTLLVSGTHGKTTTSSILAWILYRAGLDPSFMIGGILKNFDSNYRLGNGPFFVVEGDEYDTAFFDKGAKFLHYRPQAAVVTGVEFDHADIFRDLDHVKQVFGLFLSGLHENSLLMAYDDDENVTGLLRDCHCRVARYGTASNSPWRLGAITVDSPWTRFEIFKDDRRFGIFKTRLFGKHNLLNTLADIAIADHLKIPRDVIAGALESFDGIKRRQEIRGQERGITVMDDFAHHPTAVRETLRAVQTVHSNGRVIAVFEPRTNTSMRDVFQNEYVRCFDGADLVCIRKPPLLKKIPPGHRFSSSRLVDDLRKRGLDAHYFEDTEAIIDFLTTRTRSGDLVLIMSNGGFDNIHQRLLDRL